ncbi:MULTISPECIES: histidine phosphatase family protein [Cetobacterium]|jgi:alpha-ribazole phosphatase|uniref:Histidine phosphatase family protein n=1 Tax=Candidatus Cetobacterium colombiensis TaxID=3073100 RepID=A0ABU4WAW7_9FUSO|nr:histidine phosphatase family protein [Candidatus Cetobacterium colombiensis]MDX8335721.1 histidine phosphatase family protein [Candidatus Cetobacterium colombiensis]
MGKIILVRHGESKLNVKGVYYGILNPELTEKGKQQANQAREILKNINYHKIFASDLKRAVDTAEIINCKELDILIHRDLRELNFGIFEGQTYTQLLEKYPEELKESQKNWENYNYITGESVLQLQKRAIAFIEREINLEENTVLVTHWGVINTILSYYFSKNLDSYWKFSVKNGGIVIIEFSDGYPILKGLNIGG